MTADTGRYYKPIYLLLEITTPLIAYIWRCHGGTRLPISKELLSNLITVLPSVCASDYEAAHFSAAFSVALFGCLRVGEFTLSKQSQMHQVIGIENIKFILNSGVQQIDLVIPASKTDQYGNGCLVKISENKSYQKTKVLSARWGY